FLGIIAGASYIVSVSCLRHVFPLCKEKPILSLGIIAGAAYTVTINDQRPKFLLTA
ncbi:hypothetical protein HMPREF9104_00820, partial [Lentilactobacillus kisonensis F0435]